MLRALVARVVLVVLTENAQMDLPCTVFAVPLPVISPAEGRTAPTPTIEVALTTSAATTLMMDLLVCFSMRIADERCSTEEVTRPLPKP